MDNTKGGLVPQESNAATTEPKTLQTLMAEIQTLRDELAAMRGQQPKQPPQPKPERAVPQTRQYVVTAEMQRAMYGRPDPGAAAKAEHEKKLAKQIAEAENKRMNEWNRKILQQMCGGAAEF